MPAETMADLALPTKWGDIRNSVGSSGGNFKLTVRHSLWRAIESLIDVTYCLQAGWQQVLFRGKAKRSPVTVPLQKKQLPKQRLLRDVRWPVPNPMQSHVRLSLSVQLAF